MSASAAGKLALERRDDAASATHARVEPAAATLDAPDLGLRTGAGDRDRSGEGAAPIHNRDVAALQRAVGNRAVSDLLARRRRAETAPGAGQTRRPAVQRHIGPSLAEDIEPGTGTGTGTGTGGGGLDYTALATRLRDAMEGLGTDEDAIYAALGQLRQDPARITALTTAYRALTGRTLDADLNDDLSGSELARAQRLLRPPDRRQQIEELLATTDTGRWVIRIIRKWDIPVDYEFTGTGSFHRAGSIFINRTLSVDAAVLVMMHEAQHANTFKSGLAADVDALGRDEYIRAKIADEAEAVVRQIEGAVPMTTAGHSMAGSGINQGLIDQYRAAFYVHRDALEASNPTMSRAEINTRCRTHTRDNLVTNWFYDGTFVTSTGPLTYSQHYGNTWDGAHNPPTPSPSVTGEEAG